VLFGCSFLVCVVGEKKRGGVGGRGWRSVLFLVMVVWGGGWEEGDVCCRFCV